MSDSIVSTLRVEWLVFAVLGLSACRRAPPPLPKPDSVASATIPVAAASARVDAAAPTLPPDLDVQALERQLHCPSGRHPRACRILREFAAASHGIGQVPSGQGRWMGSAYRVDKGREKADFVILAAMNVPASSVGPTDLPLRVAMGALPKDKRRDGRRLVRALSHSEMPPRSNKALPFVQAWTSENGRIAMATGGPSIRLIAEEATYVRQAGQKALVIQMKPALPGVATFPGDGTYAELWPVTW